MKHRKFLPKVTRERVDRISALEMRELALFEKTFRPYTKSLLDRYARGAVVDQCEYSFPFAPSEVPKLPQLIKASGLARKKGIRVRAKSETH